jgi:hypothetical protein
MNSELKNRFTWAEDDGVMVAYCTNHSGEHFRLVWWEEKPAEIQWAKCKCRGCMRMDVLEQGTLTIKDMLAKLDK